MNRDITVLRDALTVAYRSYDKSDPTYSTDATIGNVVKAVHLQELRGRQ